MLWCRDSVDDKSCLLDDIAFVVVAVPIDLFGIDTVVPMAVEWEPIVAVGIADIDAAAAAGGGAAAAVDMPECQKYNKSCIILIK